MKAITNEIIKKFELYLYEKERSGNTIEKYMRDIRFFREWLNGRNIDKSVVIEYKKELCERYAVVDFYIKILTCSKRVLFGFNFIVCNSNGEIIDSCLTL